MNDPIESFFGPARRLALSAAERSDAWNSLQGRVRAGAEGRLHGAMDRHATLLQAGTRLQLSDAEKNEGLAALRAHMARTPVRAGAGGWNWLRALSSAVAGLATATAAFGTVAMAAEGAVPGDALYAIKIAVNDPVVAMYVRGSAGSEAAEEVLLGRRVHEVRTLARRGDRPTAVAHLRATERAAATIAQHRPEAPVLALRTDTEHSLDGTIAVAAVTNAEVAAEATTAMDIALPFAMDSGNADHEERSDEAPPQERGRAMKAERTPGPAPAAMPMAADDGGGAELSLQMAAQEPDAEIIPAAATFLAEPVEDAIPEAMMVRKALAPVAPLVTGSGSAGSGSAAESGTLLGE